MYRALVVRLRDYVVKNGFRSVTFGFSGGSTPSAPAIAADRRGTTLRISMPTTTSPLQDDAFDLRHRRWAAGCCDRPHVRCLHVVPGASGLAEENLQARIRGTAVMAVSEAT